MLKLKNLRIILYLTVVLLIAVFSLDTSVIYASSILEIKVKDKTYKLYSYEVSKINGIKTLNKIDEVIDGIYLDNYKKPVDAEISFNTKNDNKFYIKNEINGEEIDKILLKNQILYNLNNDISTIICKTRTIYPQITKENLKLETNLRSQFSTNYSSSSSNRKHNIDLATSKINGYILKNNEEFSFNKIVGERTEKNGFKNAKVISNNTYIDGVGGGVCQVSTTLYNTALLSGLKITEQHNHSLLVSYVEPSFDAMVSSYYCDLKFVNNTGKNIYICGYADGNKVSFKFYGIKQNEKYARVSKIISEIEPPNEQVEYSKEILSGDKIIKQYAKKGTISEGYIITYINDKLIKQTKIRKDKYSPIPQIVKIGI